MRLIVAGWTANHSVKWLRRIGFSPHEDDGFWMAAEYRVPDAAGVDRVIETPVPIAIIATPEDGGRCPTPCEVTGIAYGHPPPPRVLLEVDEARAAEVETHEQLGPYAWRTWRAALTLAPGLHRLRVRPVDAQGRPGPAKPTWNARGYCYDGPHSIEIVVTE